MNAPSPCLSAVHCKQTHSKTFCELSRHADLLGGTFPHEKGRPRSGTRALVGRAFEAGLARERTAPSRAALLVPVTPCGSRSPAPPAAAAVPRGSAGAAGASAGGAGTPGPAEPSRHELLAGRHGRPQRRPAALGSGHGERGTGPGWGRAGGPGQPRLGPPCRHRLRRCL